MREKLNKLICKYIAHDSTISFYPNRKSPSGYNYIRHCLRCKETFEEGPATI